MVAAKIKIGTMLVLLTLTCSGVCQPPAPASPAPPSYGKPTLDNSTNWAEKLFPDGVVRDFGMLQCGTEAYHAFRIVNTSKVPISVLSVRLS